MSLFRKKEEWDWEVDTENYENWDEYEHSPSQKEGYEEGVFNGEAKEGGISYPTLFFLIGLILYAGFLVLGIFTTDYKDGKAYVVNADVRQERAYIDRLTPFYNVVINTPDAVESLENNTSNSIDLIYKLTKLKDAISSMQKEIKTTKAPEVYTAYQQYLIELSDEETALLQSVIAYHQDPNQDRMPEIQEQLDNVHDGIQNVKNQMNDIQKRLIRNQQ